MVILDCDGRYTQLGIRSEYSVCPFNFPNLYTRVTSFMDWIRETSGDNFYSSFMKIQDMELPGTSSVPFGAVTEE